MEWIFLWMICGVIAAAIGARKGEAISGFFIGAIFGPFGVLFAILSSGNRLACPHCKEMVHKQAKVCPHCRRDMPMR